jgi:hypothetical protein
LALDADEQAKARAEHDDADLSTLGPEPTQNSGSAAEDESLDAGALAALSQVERRGELASGLAAKSRVSDPDEARLNLSALRAEGLTETSALPTDASPRSPVLPEKPLHLASPAQVSKAVDSSAQVGSQHSSVQPAGRAPAVVAVASGRRWLLPMVLVFGIGLGVLVSTILSSRSSDPRGVQSGATAPIAASSSTTAPPPPTAAEVAPAVASAQTPPRTPAIEAAPPAALEGSGAPVDAIAAKSNPPSAPLTAAAAALPVHPPASPALQPRAASGEGVVRAASAVEKKPAADPAPAHSASASAAAAPPSAAERAAQAAPDSEEGRLAAASGPTSSDGALDKVLDDAFANGHAGSDRATASAAALPSAPSRDDVIKTMTVLVSAIRGCAQGQSGLANVAIVVKNDGRVESASLSGPPFAETASGRCMEGVVRRARFPRFRQASFRVQFPFAIQ